MFKHPRILLNLGVEFGPLLIFFVCAQSLGFGRAVIVFVATTIIAVVVDLWIQRRFAVFPVVVAAFIITFGGATIISGNPKFIELDYTIYPLVFGGAAFLDIVMMRNRLFKSLFHSVFAMDDRGWFLLTRNWVFMFFAMAVANEVARQSLVPQQWVFFRIGVSVIVLAFSAYQLTISRRYRLPEANEYGLRVV